MRDLGLQSLLVESNGAGICHPATMYISHAVEVDGERESLKNTLSQRNAAQEEEEKSGQ